LVSVVILCGRECVDEPYSCV